jgi:hypothetical protein
MERGHSEGEVVVHDDCGNGYALGTRSYAWAFEVSLWHHARAGHIVPECGTAEQEKAWSDFVGRKDRPSPPDVGPPQPVWDIPFRLPDAVYSGKAEVTHVGTVS